MSGRFWKLGPLGPFTLFRHTQGLSLAGELVASPGGSEIPEQESQETGNEAAGFLRSGKWPSITPSKECVVFFDVPFWEQHLEA